MYVMLLFLDAFDLRCQISGVHLRPQEGVVTLLFTFLNSPWDRHVISTTIWGGTGMNRWMHNLISESSPRGNITRNK